MIRKNEDVLSSLFPFALVGGVVYFLYDIFIKPKFPPSHIEMKIENEEPIGYSDNKRIIIGIVEELRPRNIPANAIPLPVMDILPRQQWWLTASSYNKKDIIDIINNTKIFTFNSITKEIELLPKEQFI